MLALSALPQFAVAQAPSSVTLTTSSNPSVYGAPVALTAAVTPSGATGHVTFYDGTTILGISTISAGQAVLSTGLLASGARSLRAYYSGDSSHAASSSVSVPQTVEAKSSLGFKPAFTFSVGPSGSDLQYMAVGDFNGDGKPDLAIINTYSAPGYALYVLLNKGDGTLLPPVSYSLPYGASGIGVGDFNGDGITDIVVLVPNFGTPSILVFLGKGDGTFANPLNQVFNTASWYLVVGDFNGDGKADLAVSDVANNTIVILLGNGDGTFQQAGSFAVGTYMRSISVSDFNGDEKADLAVDNYQDGTIGILLGKGDGTFQPAVNYPSDPSSSMSSPVSLIAWDFNRDGRLDLAVINGGTGNVGILFGNGDGTFQPATTFAARPGLQVAEDFNGDGKPDLAAGDSFKIDVFLGNGNGTFQPVITYPAPLGFGNLVVADMDGDGTVDLIGDEFGAVTIFYSGAVPDLAPTFAATTTFTRGQIGARYTLTVGNVGSFATTATVNAGVTLAPGLSASAIAGSGWTCSLATVACSRSDSLAFGSSFPPITIWVNVAKDAPLTVASTAAVSGGGEVNLANDASSLSVPVFLATSISMGSSLNPAVVGQNVTLTATVTAGSGRVTFYDGTTVLGTAPLSGSQARFTTSLLPTGTNSLWARYDGDSTYGPSNSATVLQTMTATSANGFSIYSFAAAGGNPYAIAVGDFNGDGFQDLVTTSATMSTNTVSIFLGNGNGAFRSPVSYNVSSFPNSVVVADLNGDGKQDLAIAMNSGGMVAVLLGNGDGTFNAPVYVTIGTPIAYLAVADFNLDGIPDLAGIGAPGTIAVLLGNGDGTFQSPISSDTGILYPGPITIGDFNGDGKPDLVVSEHDLSLIIVLLGNGDGTFAPPLEYSGVSYPSSLTAGDLNGDGKLDLIVGGGNGTVYTLLGNGDGSFQAPISYYAGSYNDSIAVGDFNGDGKLDVATASYTLNFLAVLLGNGDGTLGAPATFSLGTNPNSIAVGDFNRDGRLDVAVANSGSGNISVLLGMGGSGLNISVTHSGSFIPGQTGAYRISVSNSGLSAPSGTTSVSDSLPAGLTATAIGGTGWSCTLSPLACWRSDQLATGASFPAITLTVNIAGSLGVSTVVESATLTIGSGSNSTTDPTRIVLASRISLSVSSNPSIFGQPLTLTAAVSGGTGKVMFYDAAMVLGVAPLSGSQATLITRLLPAGKRILRATYTGDSSFAPATSEPVSQTVQSTVSGGLTLAGNYATGTGPCCVTVGDFDNDGNIDFAVVNLTSASISVFLGNGNGTFQAKVDYLAGISPVALATGDFNGDGKSDLVVADKGGNSAVVLLGNGDGTFKSAVTYPVCNSKPCAPLSVAVADFNGDGIPDIALANAFTYNLSVLLGNGDGTFQPALNSPLYFQPTSMAVGDLNGDGKADLVMTETGPDAHILLGSGDGTFQIPETYLLPYPPPVSVTVGDLNGDGKLDLITTNNSSSISVLLGNGDGSFQEAVSYPAAGWAPFASVGDIDGDGNLDVALGNSQDFSSQIFVLPGNGNGTLQSAVPFTAGREPLSLALADFNADGRTDAGIANYYDNTVSILLGAAVTSPPRLSITKTHLGNFTLGQLGAKYTVTVANAPGAGGTSGTVTVTETVPGGFTLISMTGAGWTCPIAGNTCTRNHGLAFGASYPAITVTVNVSATASSPLTNQVSVSGGGSPTAYASDATTITPLSACDINQDHNTNVLDVQLMINEALGTAPAANDLNRGGAVNVSDVQTVINAVLGEGCGAS